MNLKILLIAICCSLWTTTQLQAQRALERTFEGADVGESAIQMRGLDDSFVFTSSSASTSNCNNNALDFGSNTDNYVAVGDMGSVVDWTIEMWMKPDGEFNYQNIFHTDDLSNNQGVRLETSANFGTGHLSVRTCAKITTTS